MDINQENKDVKPPSPPEPQETFPEMKEGVVKTDDTDKPKPEEGSMKNSK